MAWCREGSQGKHTAVVEKLLTRDHIPENPCARQQIKCAGEIYVFICKGIL
ncbi:hypothetical protein I79_010415 [Cricetulus griseus]|uniref:Uncharacterized protein n=1 Tax=Cricetulus griseus TaxID=10029 RepID=G3HIF4_CRIGR|nr:hypothetical protein I79_010415 [Cricetulus griseus]